MRSLYYNDYTDVSAQTCRSDEDWRRKVAATLSTTQASVRRTLELLETLKPKDEKESKGEPMAVHQVRVDVKVLEQELADIGGEGGYDAFVRSHKALVQQFGLTGITAFVNTLRQDDGDESSPTLSGWALYHAIYVREKERQLGLLRARLHALVKPSEVVKCTCAFEVMLHELDARSKIARAFEADPTAQVARLRLGEPIPIKLRYYSKDDVDTSHQIVG